MSFLLQIASRLSIKNMRIMNFRSFYSPKCVFQDEILDMMDYLI